MRDIIAHPHFTITEVQLPIAIEDVCYAPAVEETIMIFERNAVAVPLEESIVVPFNDNVVFDDSTQTEDNIDQVTAQAAEESEQPAAAV